MPGNAKTYINKHTLSARYGILEEYDGTSGMLSLKIRTAPPPLLSITHMPQI